MRLSKAGFKKLALANNAPVYDEHTVTFIHRDPHDCLIATLTGAILWDWLYISIVWIDNAYQKQGLGTKLMQTAEAEAIKRGCVGAYVWTQSWQAAGFYTKQGYEQFVVLPNFPVGHQRIGFMKRLAQENCP
jgi:ribosomal protein S18 acetylase RimI-like enzyme